MSRRYQDCTTVAGGLRVGIADDFISRALGLLVGAPLAPREGLLIAPCSSIHTFGMRYAIDVVFIDSNACVLRVCSSVPAGRMRFVAGARAVLELRAGVATRHSLTPGVELPELADALA